MVVFRSTGQGSNYDSSLAWRIHKMDLIMPHFKPVVLFALLRAAGVTNENGFDSHILRNS
jgi:hypothetical protein